MATYDSAAIVLRAIRYSEADSILALLTPERGRLSAIVKGARRPRSKLGGRLQPGVRAHVTLHEGRGEVQAVRGAATVRSNAGLWVEGHRLLAANTVLEAAMRTLADGEPAHEAFHLTERALELLAEAPDHGGPPRLHPLVLSYRAKLLVTAGLVPQLVGCVSCGRERDTVGFSARLGGTVCPDCAADGVPVDGATIAALRGLLAAPLAEAEPLPRAVADEVEAVVGSVVQEHLGVRLRSGGDGWTRSAGRGQ